MSRRRLHVRGALALIIAFGVSSAVGCSKTELQAVDSIPGTTPSADVSDDDPLSVVVRSPRADVAQGGSTAFVVDVAGTHGRLAELSLENLPAGVDVTLTSSATAASTALVVDVRASLGQHTFVVRAREGGRTASALVQLNVVATNAFALQLVPPTATVVQGDKVSVAIDVERYPAFVDAIDVRVESSELGISASPVTIPVRGTSGIIEIATDTQHPLPSEVHVLIVGSARGLERNTTLTLHVAQRAGSLDTSFGENGTRVVDANVSPRRFGFQSDGKLLALLDRGTLARFDTDGTDDASFGVRGRVDLDSDYFWSLHVLESPDSNVHVTGWRSTLGGSVLASARVSKDGVLDATFGNASVAALGGVTLTEQEVVSSIAMGTKVVTLLRNGDVLELVRTNADGSLDASFGAGGIAVVPTDGRRVAPEGLVEHGGKVVVAGTAEPTTTEASADIFVSRVDNSGVVDSTFGAGGRRTIDMGGDDRFGQILARPDGSVVLLGSAGAAGGRQGCFVARLTESGALDAAFGQAGKVAFATTVNGACFGGTIQQDGKLVVAGRVNDPVATAAVFRRNEDGTADTTFGGGMIKPAVGNPMFWVSSVGVQRDGRIVVAGALYDGRLFAARFWP